MAYLLQQLLSKSAKKYPAKAAVWARGRSITYGELEEKFLELASPVLGEVAARALVARLWTLERAPSL